MVPPASHRVSRVRRYSGSSLAYFRFRLRGSHPLWPAFPYRSANLSCRCVGPQPRRINPSVCPLPRSLATTCGISVDFSSSPYLDVSVQAVPHLRLFDSTQADGVLLRRVSPFGDPGINAYVRLPQAYRSLSRPSSAPDAKAFPLRSFQLDLVGARLRAPWSENLGSLRIMQASTEVLAWLIVLPNFSSYTTCFALCCLLSYFILHCSVFKVPAFQPLSRPDRNIQSPGCFDLVLTWWR